LSKPISGFDGRVGKVEECGFSRTQAYTPERGLSVPCPDPQMSLMTGAWFLHIKISVHIAKCVHTKDNYPHVHGI
jgi:hypothetical protein